MLCVHTKLHMNAHQPIGGFPIEIETQISKLIIYSKACLFWFQFLSEIHLIIVYRFLKDVNTARGSMCVCISFPCKPENRLREYCYNIAYPSHHHTLICDLFFANNLSIPLFYWLMLTFYYHFSYTGWPIWKCHFCSGSCAESMRFSEWY